MLYYIKQHFSKLVIAGDYEAMFNGHSSQLEEVISFDNSGDPIIQIHAEVKKTHFFPEYLNFSQLLI